MTRDKTSVFMITQWFSVVQSCDVATAGHHQLLQTLATTVRHCVLRCQCPEYSVNQREPLQQPVSDSRVVLIILERLGEDDFIVEK